AATCTWSSTAGASIASNATVATRWTMDAPAFRQDNPGRTKREYVSWYAREGQYSRGFGNPRLRFGAVAARRAARCRHLDTFGFDCVDGAHLRRVPTGGGIGGRTSTVSGDSTTKSNLSAGRNLAAGS